MKTAMQEVKEKLLDGNFLNDRQKIGAKHFLEVMLEKEKQQIVDACFDATIMMMEEKKAKMYAEQYYNETFNK